MALKKFGMDFVANFLNSRSVREKQLIISFILVFIVLMDVVLLIQPVTKLFLEEFPRIAPVKAELKGLREDQKNREAIQKKWEEAKRELTEKEKMFIAPDETPALLENLSKEALKSGVKIMSLEPFDQKSASGKTVYASLPIHVKAVAGTHEFGAFLARLENGQTFFKVTDLKIAANPLNERKQSIELAMEAYKRDK